MASADSSTKMAAIGGLSDAQNKALTGVAIGDLIFISKSARVYEDPSDDEDSASESSEAGEDGASANGDNDQEDENEDDSGSEDGDSSTTEDNDRSDGTDDTETSASTTIFQPRMYVVASLNKDATGAVTAAKISVLAYANKVNGTNSEHAYQIYGKECVHNHLSDCHPENGCAAAVSILDIVTDDTFQFMTQPSGDHIRRLDTEVWASNQSGSVCADGCNRGWLSDVNMLRDMVKDYDPPTLAHAAATGQTLPTSLQPAVCPVCIGLPLMKEQQLLQGMLLQGNVDIGAIVEFHGRLNPRRRELGYGFQQFDEREWGMLFDDINSEDEGEEDGDGGRWETFDEAQDPNANVMARPASDATIAALPRKLFKDANLDVTECGICTSTFDDDTVLVELPCGHANFDEPCVKTWLKQSDSCPLCRKKVPAVAEPDNAPSDPAANSGTAANPGTATNSNTTATFNTTAASRTADIGDDPSS